MSIWREAQRLLQQQNFANEKLSCGDGADEASKSEKHFIKKLKEGIIMNPNFRKILAVVLTVGMVLSMLPVTAFAKDETDDSIQIWMEAVDFPAEVTEMVKEGKPAETEEVPAEVMDVIEEENYAEAEPNEERPDNEVSEETTGAFGGALVMASDLLVITNSAHTADIANNIQGAITAASPGDTLTVTGSKTNETGVITLNVPSGITMAWEAISKDISIIIDGGGTFEVASGGKIEVTDKNAIEVVTGNVIVSGGEVSVTANRYSVAIYVANGDITVLDGKVSAIGMNPSAIEVDTGNIKVSGGEVSVDGSHSYGYAVCINKAGTVAVTGGSVLAANAFAENNAIFLDGIALAAYLKGTCVGDFRAYGTGIIVEVESPTIPSSYSGTANGLTHMADNVSSTVKWNTSKKVPIISLNNGQHEIEWGVYKITPPEPSVEHPVRLDETGEVFDTLSEAIAAAKNTGLNAYTLEVIGDVTEIANPVIVTSDIIIVGAEGSHTITGASIKVESGGSLTLGDGSEANLLTILGSVRVENGTVNAKDGIVVISGRYALELSGPNTTGTINGGRFKGDSGTLSSVLSAALHLESGARITEISGGVFSGKNDAVYLSDASTKIDKISGGAFYQTDATAELQGHAVFVDSESQIGEISGGYFEAVRHCAMYVIRGGWVDKISGGEFVATRRGTDFDGNAPNPRNSVLRIEAEHDLKTGVGTISEGLFHGGAHFGILLINYFNSTTGPCIDLICGGDIQGIVALQPDVGTYVGEISGGVISGNQGMLNAGTVGKISENAKISGTSSYGIYNYSGSWISEICGGVIVSGKNHGIANAGTINLISGGTITSGTSAFCSGISNSGTINHISGGAITGGATAFCHGIENAGTITLISGGTIIGGESAAYNTGARKGRLETISDGVFWGKTGTAITLAYEMKLEPGLSDIIGSGRYWGKDGVIFNDESLVIYPDGYWISTETLPVSGIAEVEFKYLTNGQEPEFYTVIFDTNEGRFADGEETAIRIVIVPETKVGNNMPADPTRDGYTFLGWSREKDGSGTAFTAATAVTGNITVYAQWKKQAEKLYTVTFDGNGGTVLPENASRKTGGGSSLGSAMPPNPTRSGYTFLGWNREKDGSGTAFTAATTVIGNITVYAQWKKDSGANGNGGNTPPSPPPPLPQPFIAEHVAYIIGYPDGYVRPERNITRAEVVTIFFRLLTDEVRAQHWTQDNPFPDVQKGMWHNNAISVMYKMGILKGFPDGTYLPDNAITRAEFAAIAARFARMMQMKPKNDLRFSDVTGHWAESDIAYAVAIGWVNGYPDGTFRPNRNITRAEAMTLVNRMLGRIPETAHDLLAGEMKTWIDNAGTNAWYYLAVQEATNSHVPEYNNKTVPGLLVNHEHWVAMLPNCDWAQLEKEWSNAY